MSQLLSWILIKIDLLSWLCHVMICIRKINWTLNSELWLMISINAGECVENWTESVTWIFVCFLPPTNWTLNSWWKLKKGKWKGMRESCLVYCYSGIQSLFEVVLLYTFYTPPAFFHFAPLPGYLLLWSHLSPLTILYRMLHKSIPSINMMSYLHVISIWNTKHPREMYFSLSGT